MSGNMANFLNSMGMVFEQLITQKIECMYPSYWDLMLQWCPIEFKQANLVHI
jgi:hypothetical protein